MASSTILHDVPAAMIQRIERSTSHVPEILGATEVEEDGHTVTTVLYRTISEFSHATAADRSKQITLRAEIFVDGEGQTGLIVNTSFEQPPASTAYLQLVEFVESGGGPRARMGRRVGYLTLDRSGEGVPRVRLRDPHRKSGGQYAPVFERHVEAGAKEPLELRCGNGRYAPAPAFFASGAVERVNES